MSENQQTLDDAREQADEHGGFLKSGTVKAPKTGEAFTVPNLLLLTDEQQEDYDDLQHRIQQCDRWPDTTVPRRTVKQVEKNDDGTETVTETVIESHTVRGDFIEPYQENGQRIKPGYKIQLAQILLGDGYKRYTDAGGSAAKVYEELLRMRKDTEERARNDSKSADSTSPVETVPKAD